VVSCDVSGSAALGERLDLEALRQLLHRYSVEMRAVLERYGGLVEKFIGDAVVEVAPKRAALPQTSLGGDESHA